MRLVVTLTEDQYAYLQEQKLKHGVSYAGQVREMIRQRMEGTSYVVAELPPAQKGRSRSFTKRPEADNIRSINQELKELFARRKMQVEA